MEWTVLVDNRAENVGSGTENTVLETEHGLSILLDTGKQRVLLDTGASDLVVRNAKKLGIDLSTVDDIFLSHGHSDHAGGLKSVLEVNHQAKVIVSPDALSGQFFSKRRYLHSITPTWPVIPEERKVVVFDRCEVDGLQIIARIPQQYSLPKGNQNLFVKDHEDYVPDDFRHELALYVDGLLFTGCAHNGLENILEACPWPVRWVVGGFHLLDDYEANEELTALGERLCARFPDTTFFTSHCTGNNSFQMLRQVMGDRLQAFSCGMHFR